MNLRRSGEVSERLKEHAWKVCIREIVSWVRIPPSPPDLTRKPRYRGFFVSASKRALRALLYCLASRLRRTKAEPGFDIQRKPLPMSSLNQRQHRYPQMFRFHPLSLRFTAWRFHWHQCGHRPGWTAPVPIGAGPRAKLADHQGTRMGGGHPSCMQPCVGPNRSRPGLVC